ncbi:MAG: NIPSNAP family protein [Lacunisphaera sp.]
MNFNRRTFLKSTLAASAATALTSKLAAAPAVDAGRDFYELRCYKLHAGSRIKTDANPALLDAYLEHAFLPALDQRGVKNVGVFTEIVVQKEAATSTPKPDSPVWVLIPHATPDSFVAISADLNADPAVQKAGADYLNVPKAHPAFERIDSWFLRAFAGLPKLELPAFSRNRMPTRVFELRDYESHSELKALNKMAMFNDGEIALMKDLGMSPVFYGQALAGPDLPHLRYLTGAADLATHLANWKTFGAHSRWAAMKDLPKYADNTSRITSRFVVPKSYSQI